MNTIVKKIGLSIVLPLMLSGCQKNTSNKKLEESLKENNYTVERVEGYNEYKETIYYDVFQVKEDEFKSFLRGYKSETDYGLFWEFISVEKAQAWLDAYYANLFYITNDIRYNASYGLVNNVVYAGSKDAIRAAGIEIN